MRDKVPGSISAADAARVEAFLVNVRATSPDSAFRSRCQRCHGSTWSAWRPRPQAQWQGIADRIARWSPGYYRQPVAEQLVAWLDAGLGEESATMGLPAADWERFRRVEERCATCHSISWNAERYRVAEEAEAQAVAMVARMSQKMVDPLPAGMIEPLARDWLDLIADPAAFASLFPHDRPLPDPSQQPANAPPAPARRTSY